MYDLNIIYSFLPSCSCFLAMCLLFWGTYFFILPEKLIIGGLESALIFIDKIFFYKNNKQVYFFSKNNSIICFRILFLILGWLLNGREFFQQTLFITLFFFFCFKIFDILEINNKFFINKFLIFFNNNYVYKLILSIICVIISVGVSVGLIFKNNAGTGGIECIYLYIKKQNPTLKLLYIILLTDGLMIITSFFIDWHRKKDTKKNILIRYILSFICFGMAILLIEYIVAE